MYDNGRTTVHLWELDESQGKHTDMARAHMHRAGARYSSNVAYFCHCGYIRLCPHTT